MTPLSVEDVIAILRRRQRDYWARAEVHKATFQVLSECSLKSRHGRIMMDLELQGGTIKQAIRAIRRAKRKRQEGT